MAEALAAVGLASNILSFVDIGYRIISSAYEIHSSTSGLTHENTHISATATDLERVTANLDTTPLMVNDPELVDLSKKCRVLSQQLLKLLGSLQAKKSGVFRSVKAAVLARWSRKDIDSLEQRLGVYRHQIIYHLSANFFKQELPTKSQLDDIRDRAQKFQNTSWEQMDHLQNSVAENIQAVSSLESRIMAASVRTMETQKATLSEVMHYIRLLTEQLDGLRSLTESTRRVNRTLNRLQFDRILSREDMVSIAADQTFEWILDDAAHTDNQNAPRQEASGKLMNFLRSDSCVLFFCGKAGCGKSTMMRFLGTNPSVLNTLTDWAGPGRKLVLVRMYFWGSGDEDHRTLKGFYRTILFHTLGQCPELFKDIFPDEFEKDEPVDRLDSEFLGVDLEKAFARLAGLGKDRHYRFCYFIDGLDEYKEDRFQGYGSLGRKLVSWASLENVKIVCSARPYTVFQDIFEPSGVTVELHDLTRSDIATFAGDRFRTEINIPKRTKALEACLDLVDTIVDRADGVFLWASLVVQSLINGALGGEDKKALEERLTSCPNDVDNMFRDMLGKVQSDTAHRRKSNLLIYLAVHNPFERGLNALMVSWLDDADWFDDLDSNDFPFGRRPDSYSDQEILERQEQAKEKLRLYTGGLLEIATGGRNSGEESIPYLRYRVRFIHQSVRDFLLRESHRPFESETRAVEAFCRLRIAEAKFMPPVLSLSSALFEPARRHLTLLYEFSFIWLATCVRKGHGATIHCLEDFRQTIMDRAVNPRESISWRVECTTNPAENSWELWRKSFMGKLEVSSKRSWRWHDSANDEGPGVFSYLHWAAYWSQTPYIRHILDHVGGREIHDNEELSLLLSAAVGTDVETTHTLLQRGWRPDDLVEFNPTERKPARFELRARQYATVWLVFLRDFGNNVVEYCRKRRLKEIWPNYLDDDWLIRMAAIIESFLGAGADPEVFFVISLADVYQPVHVPLLQMIDTFKPRNEAAIELLVDRGQGEAHTPLTAVEDTEYETMTFQTTSVQALLDMDWEVHGIVSPRGNGGSGRRFLSDEFSVRVF